jgi:hypothetical protein
VYRPSEELEGGPEGDHGLEAAQHHQGEERQVHAAHLPRRDERRREGHDRHERQAHHQVGEGAPETREQGHPVLHPVELAGEAANLAPLPLLAAEDEEVLHALHVVHDSRAQPRPQLQLPPAEAAREPAREERHAGARGEQEAHGGEGHRRAEGVEDEEGDRGDDERDDERRDDAQVEVLQLLDVLDDAREQVPAAVAEEAGGREGRQTGVEAGAQGPQQLERQVVGGEPLGVAGGGARDAKEADEVDRDHEHRQVRGNGGGGDHVRRRRQQPDVADHRNDAERHREHHPPPVRPEKTEEAHRGPHATSSS